MTRLTFGAVKEMFADRAVPYDLRSMRPLQEQVPRSNFMMYSTYHRVRFEWNTWEQSLRDSITSPYFGILLNCKLLCNFTQN